MFQKIFNEILIKIDDFKGNCGYAHNGRGKYNIPLTVKIFLWMIAHGRIQSGVQLKKRRWSGPEHCKICDKLEIADHILYISMPSLSMVLSSGCFGSPRFSTCSKFLMLR